MRSHDSVFLLTLFLADLVPLYSVPPSSPHPPPTTPEIPVSFLRFEPLCTCSVFMISDFDIASRLHLLFLAGAGGGAALEAYGRSQARDQIGAAAASPHHTHSNSGSELHL